MGIFNRPLKGQQQGGPQPMQPQPVQQQAAQEPTNTVQKNDTKKKKFKIVRRVGNSVGNNITPLLIASSIAMRSSLFPNYMAPASFSVLCGVVACVAASKAKKNIYKIQERKQNSTLTISQKLKVNAAILASAAASGLLTVAISSTIPLDALVTVTVAVTTGIKRLKQKLEDRKLAKQQTTNQPVR